jgi:hypothetical protein
MVYNEKGRVLEGQLRFSNLASDPPRHSRPADIKRTTDNAGGADRQITTADDSSIRIDVEAGTVSAITHRRYPHTYLNTSHTGGVVREQEAKL